MADTEAIMQIVHFQPVLCSLDGQAESLLDLKSMNEVSIPCRALLINTKADTHVLPPVFSKYMSFLFLMYASFKNYLSVGC